jgi:hypothetical protein
MASEHCIISPFKHDYAVYVCPVWDPNLFLGAFSGFSKVESDPSHGLGPNFEHSSATTNFTVGPKQSDN